MVDYASALSVAANASAAGQGIWQLLSFLRANKGTQVIAAYFDYEGNRLYGDKSIVVERHSIENNIWFYGVKAVDDFVFIRYPVVENGVSEDLAVTKNDPRPDVQHWRYIAAKSLGRVRDDGGQPYNAKANFIVLGYKPKQLVDQFK